MRLSTVDYHCGGRCRVHVDESTELLGAPLITTLAFAQVQIEGGDVAVLYAFEDLLQPLEVPSGFGGQLAQRTGLERLTSARRVRRDIPLMNGECRRETVKAGLTTPAEERPGWATR